jgi:MSHA biogenesis protein MshJ
MKAKLHAWWQARSTREQMWAWLTLAALAVFVFDALVLSPQRAQQAKLRRELSAAQAQIEQLTQGTTHPVASSLQARRRDLEARRTVAAETVQAAQRDLIAPQEMGKQLEALLTRFPSLRVVGMTALGPKALTANGTAPEVAAGSAASSAASNATNHAGTGSAPHGGPVLYQHGVEVAVEGRYLDLLAYLDTLDRAPYRIYWRELELSVGANGVPVTRLALFTLSKEAVWLRL